MLQVTLLKRVFILKSNSEETPLSDPSDTMTPQRVMDFYSGRYPQLTTATIRKGHIKDDKIHYYFETTFGSKG